MIHSSNLLANSRIALSDPSNEQNLKNQGYGCILVQMKVDVNKKKVFPSLAVARKLQVDK